jgi:hypothetical protein
VTTPAAYPANDTEEQRAIACFEAAVDHDLVKLEIKRRDKFPNVDGFLEIVEKSEDGPALPIGKFDLQIRKLPKAKLTYSVPATLVAYSEKTTTLPVLLICSDPDENRVYWKQISRAMPEYVDGQKSFTVRFDPAVDAIDHTRTYVRRWREIAGEYQRRISHFPELHGFLDRMELKGVKDEDARFFKALIDEINRLFDYDFRTVKQHCLGDAWKLGVAIIQPEREHVCYEIFRIPYSANAPLVISVEPGDFVKGVRLARGPGGVSVPPGCDFLQYSYARERPPPEQAAREFVSPFVERAIIERTFRIAGEALAIEVIFDYLDHYSETVGLEPADEYEVAALNYGFKVYLPVWHQLALDMFFKTYADLLQKTGVFPSFEQLASMLPHESRPTWDQVRSAIEARGEPFQVPPLSHFVSLESIIQGVDDLLNRSIEKISRPYVKRRPIPGLIWSGYDEEGIRHNVLHVVTNMVPAYRELLAANEIPVKRSRFFDSDSPTVYGADFKLWPESKKPPVIYHYRVQDAHNLKTPIFLENYTGDPDQIWKTGLKISGTAFKIDSTGWSIADDLFQRTPLLNTVYAMLSIDLEEQYGMHFSSYLRSSLAS